MGRKRGFSFSIRRASGYSAAKGRLSRKIGIPLTRSGRQKKVGKAMGCVLSIITILFTILILVLTLAIVALGQKPRKQPTSALSQKRTVHPVFTNAPIDMAASSLNPGFLGADARTLFARLEARERTRQKGEFETSAAFVERVKRSEAAPLLGTLNLSSLIGLVPGRGRLGRTETEYDADRGMMSVHIQLIGNGITWADSTTDHYFYVGQNGFGATRRIEHYTQEFVDLDLSQSGMEISMVAQMDAATAKRIKPTLRLLLICELVEPFLKSEARFVEATLDSPYEEKQISRALVVKLRGLWLFDQSTGKVLAKKSA